MKVTDPCSFQGKCIQACLSSLRTPKSLFSFLPGVPISGDDASGQCKPALSAMFASKQALPSIPADLAAHRAHSLR